MYLVGGAGRRHAAWRRPTRRCSASRAWPTRCPPTARSPAASGACTRERSTPYVLIILAGVIAAGLVVPENLDFLVGIYALRRDARVHDRAPVDLPPALHRARPRPPLPGAAVGPGARRRAAAAGGRSGRSSRPAGWVAVMVVHEPARYVGLGWMAVGHRAVRRLPPRRRDLAAAPRDRLAAGAARRAAAERDYGSILVPLFGTDLDDDIVQTAALLVAGEQTDEAAIDTATIEARVDLRDPDVAAARREPARSADQARPPGARARQGGGGGVHRRAGRHRDRAHAPRRLCDRRRGAPARRGGDRARRRGAVADPRRRAPRRPRRAARGLRGRRHQVRRAQGHLPRDRHRARRRATRRWSKRAERDRAGAPIV